MPRKEAPAPATAWRELAPLPAPRFLGPQVAFAGGKLVAIGGLVKDGERYHESDRVDVYDPRRGAWQAGTPMPAPGSNLAVAAVGTRVFASGSSDGKKNALAPYRPDRRGHRSGAG